MVWSGTVAIAATFGSTVDRCHGDVTGMVAWVGVMGVMVVMGVVEVVEVDTYSMEMDGCCKNFG